jgi:hypothetical protein
MKRVLIMIFGLLLAYSAFALLGRLHIEIPGEVAYDPLAERLRFTGEYYDQALAGMFPIQRQG